MASTNKLVVGASLPILPILPISTISLSIGFYAAHISIMLAFAGRPVGCAHVFARDP